MSNQGTSSLPDSAGGGSTTEQIAVLAGQVHHLNSILARLEHDLAEQSKAIQMARDRVIALENSGRGAVSGLASQGKRIGDTESSQIALSQRVENLQWEIRNLQSDRRYDREKIAKLESEIVALTQKAIAWGAGGAVVMLILASTGAIPKFFEAVTGVIEKPSIPVQAEDKVSSPWRGE